MKDILIFFVDDDKLILNLMDYTFNNREGCKVKCFQSGQECLSNLDMSPDLIVLDYYFGIDDDEFSGKDILVEIVKKNKNIPVVMFSAQENESVKEELMAIGAWRYIQKDSFFIDTLMEAIRELPAHE